MKFKEVVQFCIKLEVLFIEDDKDAREATASFLSNFFEYVDIGIDGEDGLKQYTDYYKKNGKTYDLVITDLRMPKINGRDMIIAMRDINENQEVIVISAYHESSNLIELIQLGITKFVLKPIQSKQLIQILHSTCKSISLQNNSLTPTKHIKLDNSVLMMDISEILEYSTDLSLLYIERDINIQNKNKDIFNNIFSDVIVANNGQDGIDSFIEYRDKFNKYPDIVMTDIDIAIKSGIEISREILELNSNQIIVILSNECSNKQLKELLNMNIYKFIQKPIEFKDFYNDLIEVTKICYNKNSTSSRDNEINILNNTLNSTIEELRESIEIEKYNAQKKDIFFANMSHEIRTPMNGIIGLSHILLGTSLDDVQFDYLSKIQKSGDILLEIINDILDFSKIEAGKLDIEYIDFNLNEVLDNVSSMINVKIEEKSVELVFNIDTNVPYMLRGDPLRLGQVLINLLNNAVKFTNNGEILLKVEVINDDKLEFSVIDTGIGLKEEQIKNLFKSFSQADSSTSRHFGGSGLGLHISKQLVEMMGGDIRVESEYKVGSKFIFTILMKKQENKVDIIRPLDDFKDKNILVIDRNIHTRKTLMDIFEKFNFNSIAIDSLDNLKNTIFNQSFDFVFIDYKLMLNCRNNVVQSGCKAKVIVMKSGISLTTNQSINDIDIEAYLPKPFTQEIVFKLLVSIFTGRNIPKNNTISSISKSSLIPLKGKHIIIAEDNEINQTVMLALLSGTGINVTIANNGQEVLDYLVSNYNSVDLILMDLQMPIMNGYEAVKKIGENSNYDNIPIIALTASTQDKDIQKVKEANMKEHISKPINVELLYNILLKYISPQENKEDNIKLDFNHKLEKSIYEFENLIDLLKFEQIYKLLLEINDDAERIRIFDISTLLAKLDIIFKDKNREIELLSENFKEIFNVFILSSDKIKNNDIALSEEEQRYISKILNIEEAVEYYNLDINKYRNSLFSYCDKFRGASIVLEEWILAKEFLNVMMLLGEIKKDAEEIKAKYIVGLVIEFESMIKKYKNEIIVILDEYKKIEHNMIEEK
jgi:signal transduction histidine kinase/PleD family two-component response regulator